MTPTTRRQNSRSLLASCGDLAGIRSIKEPFDEKVRRVIFLLSVAVVLAGLSLTARSQSQSFSGSGDPSGTAPGVTSGQLDLTYERPTQRTMASNYLFDAFGPYPIAGSAFAAGINQFSNAPPEWNQGVKGYSRRFGSDFGIAAVGTTTRYGLAEAFKEDTTLLSLRLQGSISCGCATLSCPL